MENKTRHEKRSNCRCMRRCSENNLRLMYNEKLGLFLMPKNLQCLVISSAYYVQ